jgi:hypothetical protein
MQIAIVQVGPEDMEILKSKLIALKEEFEVIWEQAKEILMNAALQFEKLSEEIERSFFQQADQDNLEKSWSQQEVLQSSYSDSLFKLSSLPLQHPP